MFEMVRIWKSDKSPVRIVSERFRDRNANHIRTISPNYELIGGKPRISSVLLSNSFVMTACFSQCSWQPFFSGNFGGFEFGFILANALRRSSDSDPCLLASLESKLLSSSAWCANNCPSGAKRSWLIAKELNDKSNQTWLTREIDCESFDFVDPFRCVKPHFPDPNQIRNLMKRRIQRTAKLFFNRDEIQFEASKPLTKKSLSKMWLPNSLSLIVSLQQNPHALKAGCLPFP